MYFIVEYVVGKSDQICIPKVVVLCHRITVSGLLELQAMSNCHRYTYLF